FRDRQREALQGFRTYVVYIVRDGDLVLYVGATHYSAKERLLWHLHNRSSLGKAIIAARPLSDQWTVEMLACLDWADTLRQEAEKTKELSPVFDGKRR